MVLAARRRRRAGADRDHARSRRCSARSQGIIAQPARGAARATARTTSRSSCSTTRRGEWLAWEGSGRLRRRASTAARSTAPLAPRQPGSALKPFTYALAFEEGESPATVLPDVPSHFPDRARPASSTARATTTAVTAGRCWRGARWPDRRTFRPWRWPRELGVPNAAALSSARRLHDLRSQRPSYYGLGVTLGQRRSAARRARRRVCDVRARRRVDRSRRSSASGAARRRERTAGVVRATAFWITDILSDAEAREFIFGRGGSLEFPFPVAGEDRHVAGATTTTGRRLHARRDGRRLGRQFRSHAAARIVRRHRRRPDLPRGDARRRAPCRRPSMHAHAIVGTPTDVRQVAICALSGMRANPWCPTRTTEWLPSGDEDAAVLVASPERRRPAHNLSAGIPRLGRQRASIDPRCRSSDAPDGGSSAAQRRLQPPH